MTKEIITLTISYDRYISGSLDFESLKAEMNWLLPGDAQIYEFVPPNLRDIETDHPIGGGSDFDFFQLLISFVQQDAVTLTVVYVISTIVHKVIELIKDSEITIEKGDRKLTIKGKSKISQQHIIDALFPELSNSKSPPSPSRLERLSAKTLKVKTRKKRD